MARRTRQLKEHPVIIPSVKEPALGAFSIWKADITSKYLDFGGRASRSEFWQFMAVECAIAFALAITIIGPVVFVLATLLPSLAVTSRRLHDAGMSALLMLIPIGLWAAGAAFAGAGTAMASYGTLRFAWLVLALASASGVALYYLLARPSDASDKYGAAPSHLPGRFELELKDAFLSGIRHYFDFSGKMRRHEFWFFAAGVALVLDLLGALSSMPVLGGLFELMATLCWLFFIIPFISAVVRRLRDIGINPLFALFLPVLVLAAIAAVFAAIALSAAFGVPGFAMGFLLILAIWYVGLGYFAAVLAMPQNSEPKFGGMLR